jgi:hypothetical protein
MAIVTFRDGIDLEAALLSMASGSAEALERLGPIDPAVSAAGCWQLHGETRGRRAWVFRAALGIGSDKGRAGFERSWTETRAGGVAGGAAKHRERHRHAGNSTEGGDVGRLEDLRRRPSDELRE